MMRYSLEQLERLFDRLEIDGLDRRDLRSGYLIDEQGKKLFPPLSFSRASGTVSGVELELLQRQLFLSDYDFDRLMRCEMTRREYFERRRLQTRS
jgi:hypothetical protein